MRVAAIAACYNEPEFVSQFLRHYSAQVDHIYLLDNESTDDTLDSVSQYKDVSVEFYSTGDVFDGYQKHDEILAKKRDCIGYFNYVLILDIDELVVPKDLGLTIRQALERLPDHPVYGTDGYNMYGYPDDLPYDPQKPLIEQRKRGVKNGYYSKPIVVKPEFEGEYVLGFHGITGIEPKITPFNLLHYRGFDEGAYVRRSLRFAKRLTGPGRNYNGGGFCYWGGTEESFIQRYRHERDNYPSVRVIP